MSRGKAAACGVLAMALTLGSCTIGDVSNPNNSHGSNESEQSDAPRGKESGAPRPTQPSESSTGTLAGAELLSELPDGVDVAIGGGDHSSNGVDVPPWSTIKVPIAIAALRHDAAAAEPYVGPAIRDSSNQDAEMLWASLGDPATAAQLTEQVIADGSSSASVQTQQVRPGFSSYGQSTWTLEQQAEFARHLRCIEGANPVVTDMGNIGTGGGYGLGIISGALFKGGWGPNEMGSYGARQFGLLPRGNGEWVAVAMAATSPDGTMEGAQQRLTEAARMLQSALSQLPAAAC